MAIIFSITRLRSNSFGMYLLAVLLISLTSQASFSATAASVQDLNCDIGYSFDSNQNKCVSSSTFQVKIVPVICFSGHDCRKGYACFDADESDGVDTKTCNACKNANEFPNAEQDKCILYATVVGGVCQDEPSQCKQIENSECDPSLKTCECLLDFIPNGISNNACILPPPGYCTIGTDCSADPNSACLDEDNDGIKICVVCGEGQFPNTAQDKCLDYASEIGGSCSDQSEQCDQLENSECFSGTCDCPLDFIPNGNDNDACIPTPPGYCAIGTDCSEPNSACFDDDSDGINTCVICGQNQFPSTSQDKCLDYATQIGGSCSDQSEQCNLLENSECTSGTCDCLPNFISNGNDNNACIPAPPGYCTIGTDCSADPNSACLDEDNDGIKICVVCGEGQFPNTAKDKCLDYASEIGGSCSDQSEQCDRLENSECFSGTCSCPTDEYVENQAGDKCLKLVLVGEPCEETAQCSNLGDASSCSNAAGSYVCICDLNVSYPKDDYTKCLRYATNVGGSCEENQQCKDLGDLVSEVVCDNSQCSCTENAVPTNDTKSCLQLVDYGGVCEEDIQCQVRLNNTACVEITEENVIKKECLCADGFVQGPFSKQCLTIITEEYGLCTEPIQCTEGLGELSNCGVRNRCECNAGAKYLLSEKQCYNIVNFNELCEIDEECMVGVNMFAMCKNVTSTSGTIKPLCQCKDDVLTWGNSCYEKKLLGDDCTDDLQCSVPILGDPKCDPLQGKCTCKIGYSEDFSKTACTAGALSITQTTSLFSIILVSWISLFATY